MPADRIPESAPEAVDLGQHEDAFSNPRSPAGGLLSSQDEVDRPQFVILPELDEPAQGVESRAPQIGIARHRTRGASHDPRKRRDR